MRQKYDYDEIAADVAAAYEELHNIAKVAQRFHIGTKTVTMLCKQQGIEPTSYNKPGRPTDIPADEETCFFCRAYSKTGITEGYCLTHRRMTKASAKQPCFK